MSDLAEFIKVAITALGREVSMSQMWKTALLSSEELSYLVT